MIKNKKAVVVINTGGVLLGSPMDFSKKYIYTFLSFLGIEDTEFIELDENRFKYEEKRKITNQKLESIFN